MNSRHHATAAINIVEILATVPLTRRKALRIAIIEQNGVEMVEVRTIALAPNWRETPTDHRTVIRSDAVGRVVAALAAAGAKLDGGSCR